MPKIKHIALSTRDVEKTAKFYIETFGMKQVGKVDDPGTRGVFLTDGDINLAILNFKNDTAAGIERGKSFSGIHHIGFQVENLEAIADRLTAAGMRLECSPIFCSGGELKLPARTDRLKPDFRGVPR